MEQNVFVPAHRAAELMDTLAGTDLGRAVPVLAENLPDLPMASLRCLFLTLSGCRTFVRTPFAYPFLLAENRANFKSDAARGGREPLELRPGVDCLWLGGATERFREFLARFCRAHDVERLNVRPFERLAGTLPQDLDARDVRVELARVQTNHNQPWWVKLKQELLDTPEEGWPALGRANTTDWYATFEPYLDEYLDREPDLILDVGCGLGQTARSLARRFPAARVVGLDLSPEAIEVARAKFTLPNLEYVVGDLTTMNLPQGEVDLIVSANALGYAASPARTATALFRALRPQGLFLNYCRAEESHAYWDFPRSLLLPTGEQLQQADWIPAGARHGFGCRLVPGLSGFNLAYFRAWAFPGLAERLEAVRASLQALAEPAPAPYFTHAQYAFSGRIAPDPSAWPLTAPNHPARLGAILASVVQAPEALREATALSWAFCSTELRLAPQAVQFMRLLLPGIEPILDAVYTPETVASMR